MINSQLCFLDLCKTELTRSCLSTLTPSVSNKSLKGNLGPRLPISQSWVEMISISNKIDRSKSLNLTLIKTSLDLFLRRLKAEVKQK
jgi:hypothetical protein